MVSPDDIRPASEDPLGDPADHLCRYTNGYDAVRNNAPHHRSFSDNRPVTDNGVIGDDRPHPDYRVVPDRAVVQDATVPQLNIVAYHGAVAVSGMDNHVLLHRGPAADDDGPVVAADARADANETLLADCHVANHVRRFWDERTRAD